MRRRRATPSVLENFLEYTPYSTRLKEDIVVAACAVVYCVLPPNPPPPSSPLRADADADTDAVRPMQPTTPVVLAQIMKATQTTVAMKGADERELVLGRLLGVSALAMSGRLGSEPESAEGALKVRVEEYAPSCAHCTALHALATRVTVDNDLHAGGVVLVLLFTV